MSIDHSIPEQICLYDHEFNPKDAISLGKLEAQARLYLKYASIVNQFLDFSFVLEQAPKYGIVRICFYDPSRFGMDPSFYDEESWKDGCYGKIQKLMDRKGQYEVFLNPYLNLPEAARVLSKLTGLRIKPEEVYYYVWFHECGHTRKIAGDLCPESLMGMYLRSYPKERILEFKTKSEQIADAWAVKELRRWRRNRKNRVLPSPILSLGA
jgi:hypothetical protein